MKYLVLLFMGGLVNNNLWAISSEKVEFKSHGIKLIGTLFLPKNYNENEKFPAVIVTGAWTTVKEQMPKNYAVELADKGYIALTFDFRGWGESEGKMRYLEDPARKTEDIIAAVNYLSSRKDVVSDKVAGIGVCASSGYMVKAYTKSKKLKTIALVAPWLHNRKIVNQVYGGKDAVNGYIKAGKKAEHNFKRTGKLQTMVAASRSDKKSLMFKAPYYTEESRGLIKEYDNKFNIASWKGWLTFDAISLASELPGKILIVESEKMALPQGAKEFKKIAKSNVKSVNLKNVTQFEFYDQSGPIRKSVSSISKFLQNNL